jgi:hypothetical protein
VTPFSTAIATVALIASIIGSVPDRGYQTPAALLKIVVIEGEGAVNIIQQKTAVAPVIEVRDRNDQPVAGATVNFVVRSGRAAFGGARTLTVTTNAAGRAAAAGFAPSGTGALQIGATATFQGQAAAAVTIAQTNVLTAAEAVAASSAAAGGTGGGGVSATTIGVVGGAVAGGVLVATQSQDDAPAASTTPAPITRSGTASGTIPVSFAPTNAPGTPCTNLDSQSITISIRLDSTEGAVAGTMSIRGDESRRPGTCGLSEDNNYTLIGKWSLSSPVTGTLDNISAVARTGSSFSNPRVSGEVNEEFSFTGRLAGDEIVGKLTFSTRNDYRNSNGTTGLGVGSAEYDVVLRRQ